jgi:hypothetical protein
MPNEVGQDGEVLRGWSDGIPTTDPAQLHAQSQRIEFTLGIRMR